MSAIIMPTMTSDAFSVIHNPATGEEIAHLAYATVAEMDAAVEAARRAFPAWSQTGLQFRVDLLLEMRAHVKQARDELAGIIVTEAGKTLADANAEVDRVLEALAQAASVGNWYGAPATPGVSRDVDVQEMRFPIGVVAAISPFNFPLLVLTLQSSMAIACGNTVVVKPSERVPTAALRLAELFREAGLPEGVMTVVVGDRSAVDRLLEHPDVAGITFVGSTSVADKVRTVGVANHKRVQTFGSGKNHLVVLPDADLDIAADAAVSAGFGAAGQRCMAVSVIVAVGGIGDALVEKMAARMAGIATGAPDAPATQLGPLISEASRARIHGFLAGVEGEGGRIVADGRAGVPEGNGYYLGPTLIDHVRPGMSVHSNELFGPVLSVVRVETYEEAARIIADHPLGNGAAIFTRDGGAARRFIQDTEAGQIGVNVAIPFPVLFHSFGGWKGSAYTETKLYGPGSIPFHTRSKTISIRWMDPATSAVDLGFPSHRE